MSSSDVKWIKIVVDIFDDEKMLLIEQMPDADTLIVIWFKLLCFSGRSCSKGVLMINERVPCNDEMLSAVFRRPLNTVRLALSTFENLGMIEIIDGVVTIPNWGKHQTLDKIEAKKEYMRGYMRERRAEQKELITSKSNGKINSKANVSQAERETETEIEGENREMYTLPTSGKTAPPIDYNSIISRKYVENWEQMKESNTGLLFLGAVGAGKSFFACCIANALLEKCVPVCVTNFPKLIKQASNFNTGTDIIEELQRCDLLVIDDIGVERESSFAMEQIYNIIDTRYRSGKPLIVTTNLSPAELKSSNNLERERIYDRILEMCCIPVVMDNPSRRKIISQEKREKASGLLGVK